MQTPRKATAPRRPRRPRRPRVRRRAAAAATTIIATVVAATAITAITPTACADDNGFFDPFLFIDFSRWSTVDYPGDGVTIRADGRLEFSSTQGPGSAKIVTRDALTTDAPFQAIVDYSMTFPFPGATRTGLRLELIGAPDPSDAFVIDIYRWGTTYWYEWTLFDDGHGIDGGFGQTNANISDLVVSYDAVNDFLFVSSDETIPGDPVAAVVYSLTERTGTTLWRLALGGFVQGITIPVEPGEAFWDSLLVDGCFVDPADGGGSGNDGGSGSSPLGLDARSDSDWYQRGTGGSRSGWTVSHVGDIDEDGVDDFAVGAPRESTRAANAGSVRVYSGADGRQIFARHGQQGDQRGYAVAGAGDFDGDGVPDVIVGAPKAGANARGKVYVYSGRAPHELLWSRVGERGGDTLGSAVAGVGDLNLDGYDDVLIGAPGHDDKRGRAYVHLGPDGASAWIGEGAAPGDQYGRVVAGPGDANSDGFPDLLVTAPLTDVLGTNSGSFVLYSGLHGFPLVAHHGQNAGDKLGMAACGIDDVDGDGRPDLIVGAPGHDGGATNGGAAFIYRGLSGGVLLETFGSTAGEQYGRAVCGVRDLDGDDVPELAVGSPRHDAGGANAGRVSVVSGAAGTLLISINGERAGTRFGGSISGSFTQNSLGLVDMIAGAWGFRPENRRGCAYCYAFGF